MAKDIDDLLRDVFGNGKSRTISTQKAETYLQQSKQVNRGLETLEQRQKDLNDKLQDQLEELKKMSSELDFDRIQKEVEQDFGVTYKPADKTAPQPAKQESVKQKVNANANFFFILFLLMFSIIIAKRKDFRWSAYRFHKFP